MRRILRTALVPTIGLAVGVAVLPARADLFVHVWITVSLTLLLAVGLETLREQVPARPSEFETATRGGATGAARPAALATLERQVTTATASAYDVHHRLRPLLSPLATEFLATHHVDPARHPARARELLGDPLWSVVDPARPAPHDRSAPGLRGDALPAMLDRLERL